MIEYDYGTDFFDPYKKYNIKLGFKTKEKIKIRNEYWVWLKEKAPISDSIITFLTFLDEMGYLKDNVFEG